MPAPATPSPPLLDLHGVHHLVVLTGAGISAGSGLFTYRGPGGIYTDPARKRRASLKGFLAEPPEVVWGHYGALRATVRAALPNAAHRALAARAARGAPRVTVITQNVDGLHPRAGPHEVIELHGSVLRTRCMEACGAPAWEDAIVPPDLPAPCPSCGGRPRPDVVLFGEGLDPAVRARAREASASADLLLVVGSSGQVGSARAVLRAARAAGARAVCLDVDHQPQDHWSFDAVHEGRAEVLLPRMLEVDAAAPAAPRGSPGGPP